MRLPVLLSLLLASGIVQAQGKVVIYRCTDANGALTVQNDVPCPKGSTQQKRVMQTAPAATVSPSVSTTLEVPIAPAPAPTPPSPAPVPAPEHTRSQATIADADRLPPPALFECRTYDNDRYLSDHGNPPQRCAPLQTTGVGGTAPAAGVACRMVSDQCQRIADGALCGSWTQRLREAESTLRFGVAENRDTAQANVERIGKIVRESTCGR